MPCHGGNDIAPINLTSYKKVAAYSQMINYVTQERLMPPFRATAGHFVGERRLSEAEIDQIARWVKAGAPEGVPEHEQLARVPHSETLAEADFTVSMSESFEQYGIYYDQFRVFVLPTGLKEDKLVSAVSFEPGNRSIVKGVMISVDTGDKYRELDEWDPQYGYFSFGEIGFVPEESRWYTWNPGRGPEYLPEGRAKLLPKGARLLVHVHYGPTGVPQRDSSLVKIRWSDEKPPARLVRTAPLINPFVMTNDSFFVAAGQVLRVHAKFTVPYDLELMNIFPHAHFLGRTMEVFATFPGEQRTASLLKINDWNFHFKQGYELKEPLLLPKGTVVHALFSYDNTPGNLSNPNEPPRSVGWGKGMYEEMMLVYFSCSPVGEQGGAMIKNIPVNLTAARGMLPIHVETRQTLRLELNDFGNSVKKTLVFDRKYPRGNHLLDYDLADLPYGNYVFRLRSSENELVSEQFFLYLPSDFFD